MTARQKLDGSDFLGLLIIAGLAGVFVQSWAFFVITFFGLVAVA